jgi:hypothetical protein
MGGRSCNSVTTLCLGEALQNCGSILEFGGEKKIGAVWVTKEESVEEGRDENDIKLACRKVGADFRLWANEKYLINEYASSFPL